MTTMESLMKSNQKKPDTLRYEFSGHKMIKIGPDRWVGAETADGKAEIARLANKTGK